MHGQTEAYSYDLIISKWWCYLNPSRTEFMAFPHCMPLIMAEVDE